MKYSVDYLKSMINELGFIPENNTNNIYIKKYNIHNNYIIRINFNDEKIVYRNANISEANGISWGDSTTSNFSNSENFVVLECVDKLLEKGYKPQSITLEKKYPLGRQLKGKLDIIVNDSDDKPYLMIECKTWGSEYEKEYRKMIKDGGQLFSYYSADRATKYLCLYASYYNGKKIEYKNDIIPVDEAWIELSNVKEIHDHWNKNFKDNGIFEDWATAYDVDIKALIRSRLEPLTKDDSGRIFNQFAEILRHNVVSDKPNAFNKILNLFICKIIDEDKNDNEQVDFQWLEIDTNESLQIRLNDLYKKGMHRFLDIDVTDFSDDEVSDMLININDDEAKKVIQEMFVKLRLQKNPEFAFIEVYDDNSFKLNARVVREVVELLQPYQFRYGHKQQFLGDFFELLLNTSIKQEVGQFFTPVPITRYIVSSLPIKEFIEKKLKTDDPDILPSVIDFACGTGHFLTEYMDKVQTIIENNIGGKNAKPTARKKLNYWTGDDGKFEWASDYVYGIDADYRLVKSSKVSSFLNGDGEANIIRANGLDHFEKSKEYRGKLKITSSEDKKDNAQFDVLIANPPYSVNAFKSTVKYGEESFELFNKLTDNSSEIECLFIERMKQLLKVGGYAGIVLPSSILSNTGLYSASREILIKYFKIVAITEFGSNTFMATGTNTVTLFLERRANTDHKHIENAIISFFDKPKDVTVLGIEKAFSKYVNHAFENIAINDYISFVNKKPTIIFKQLEIYVEYQNWFDGLTEIKNLKTKKSFNELSSIEQNKKLEKLFYEKVFAIEKDKLLYFLLTYSQKTVVIKTGEKQDEKDFLGYEFSNRRGHEGIKMLPNGTKLYDENDPLNSEKANSYIYNAFIGEYPEIVESLANNIYVIDTCNLIDYGIIQFEKAIGIGTRKQNPIETKWKKEKLRKLVFAKGGDSFPKEYQKDDNIDNIPFLKVSDMNHPFNWKYIYNANNYIDENIAKNKLSATIFEKNNIIFPKVGMAVFTDKKRILTRSSCVDNNIMCLNILDKNILNYEFLYQIFNYYIQLKNFASTANPPSIITDKLMDFKIPIPPIGVQEKIVSEINLLEKVENMNIEKITSLKAKLLKPEFYSFSTEQIEKISLMIQRGKSASYGKSNIQIIKSGQARGYMEFDFSQRHYVSESFVSDERNLQKGDILINSTGVGTAGRVTLFDLNGNFVVDSHITIVRLNKDLVIPKYVLYAFANIGFKNIEKMATGQSGQIELGLSIIKNIKIPLPPIEIQEKVVAEISNIENEIYKLEEENANFIRDKQNILTSYLS